MTKKYIYKTEYLQWDASDDILNALGHEGWELVSVVCKSLNNVSNSPLRERTTGANISRLVPSFKFIICFTMKLTDCFSILLLQLGQ